MGSKYLSGLLAVSVLCGHAVAAPQQHAVTATNQVSLIKTDHKAGKAQTNFIFVLSDDIAQGDVGCYGQKLIKTPRLDQMAKEGTRFLQAYCGTSVCAPSRSSFFTGLHTGHCPVRGNYEVPPEG